MERQPEEIQDLSLAEKAEQAFGVELTPVESFGVDCFFAEAERSSSVLGGHPGSAIVGAARTLGRIQRGKMPLLNGPTTQRAQEIMAKSEAARASHEQEAGD